MQKGATDTAGKPNRRRNMRESDLPAMSQAFIAEFRAEVRAGALSWMSEFEVSSMVWNSVIASSQRPLCSHTRIGFQESASVSSQAEGYRPP